MTATVNEYKFSKKSHEILKPVLLAFVTAVVLNTLTFFFKVRLAVMFSLQVRVVNSEPIK